MNGPHAPLVNKGQTLAVHPVPNSGIYEQTAQEAESQARTALGAPSTYVHTSYERAASLRRTVLPSGKVALLNPFPPQENQ
jgi:hypothetical protein